MLARADERREIMSPGWKEIDRWVQGPSFGLSGSVKTESEHSTRGVGL